MDIPSILIIVLYIFIAMFFVGALICLKIEFLDEDEDYSPTLYTCEKCKTKVPELSLIADPAYNDIEIPDDEVPPCLAVCDYCRDRITGINFIIQDTKRKFYLLKYLPHCNTWTSNDREALKLSYQDAEEILRNIRSTAILLCRDDRDYIITQISY